MTTDRSRSKVTNPKAPEGAGFNPDTPAEGSRIIEFIQNSETFRVEILGSQRFTFGPFAPGAKGFGGSSDLALRIYEGSNKDNQLAVFRGVSSVRDLSVKLIRKLSTETGEDKYEINADGSTSDRVIEKGVDWVPV